MWKDKIYRVDAGSRHVLEEEEDEDRSKDGDNIGGVLVVEELLEEVGEELLGLDGDVREDEDRHDESLKNENQIPKVHKREHR